MLLGWRSGIIPASPGATAGTARAVGPGLGHSMRRLALGARIVNMTVMKLTAAFVVHLALITAFIWGILLLGQGKPALLLGAIAVYAVLFGKIGCAAH